MLAVATDPVESPVLDPVAPSDVIPPAPTIMDPVEWLAAPSFSSSRAPHPKRTTGTNTLADFSIAPP